MFSVPLTSPYPQALLPQVLNLGCHSRSGLPYLCRALSHLLDLILILHELSIQSRNLLVNGFCPAVHLEGKKNQRQWYLL